MIDPESGRRLQEVEFKDLSEIENPAFTPDGRAIVFSAMQGGLLDLWLYDLEIEAAPAADERRLRRAAPAGVARRQDGRLHDGPLHDEARHLDFGNYRIGLLDLASGAVREVPGYPNARNSNPQWSPDGNTVFFLSDMMGGDRPAPRRPRERRAAPGDARCAPASTASRRSARRSRSRASVGRIAYTVREDGKHNIYAIDDKVKQAGVVVTAERIAQNASDAIRRARRRRPTASRGRRRPPAMRPLHRPPPRRRPAPRRPRAAEPAPGSVSAPAEPDRNAKAPRTRPRRERPLRRVEDEAAAGRCRSQRRDAINGGRRCSRPTTASRARSRRCSRTRRRGCRPPRAAPSTQDRTSRS